MRQMNLRVTITLFALVFGAIMLSGCGEDQSQVKKNTEIPAFNTEPINKELAKYPIQGFDYKGTNPTKADWDEKAKAMLPYVKSILTTIPEGYVIEVRGHADASGPEEPVGNKKGNIYWSEQRATNVRDALVRQGIPKEKLKVRGVGSSELIPDPNTTATGRSKLNRRVTFHVVQQ